jgi:hypothetical protein
MGETTMRLRRVTEPRVRGEKRLAEVWAVTGLWMREGMFGRRAIVAAIKKRLRSETKPLEIAWNVGEG